MRKNILILLALSLVATGFGYYLSHIHECGYSILCANLLTKAHSIYIGMGALSLVFFFLSIFPNAFPAWSKFALWFLPFAIDLFISYKGPSGGFMDPLPTSELVYRWVGGFYFVVSFLIIITSFFLKKFGKIQPTKIPSEKRKIIFWTLWCIYVATIVIWHFFD